jgi:hypothetical protein
MFATLALRSIKCVNSNLLGIWKLRLPYCPNCGRSCKIAKDSGRLRTISQDLGRLRTLRTTARGRIHWVCASCQKLRLWNIQSEFELVIGHDRLYTQHRAMPSWTALLDLPGPRKWGNKLASKMHRTERTQEMELSLYYRGVKLDIEHLPPRCKARAP